MVGYSSFSIPSPVFEVISVLPVTRAGTGAAGLAWPQQRLTETYRAISQSYKGIM
jgi:hypothetical protein